MPTRAMIASVIANVRGSSMMNRRALAWRACRATSGRRAPAPSCAPPPCRRRARSRDRPRLASKIRARRESAATCRARPDRPVRRDPLAARAADHLHGVHAAAVIGNFQHDHVAHAGGAQTDDGPLGLASGGAFRGRFNAVADRIPHQVQHGIEHALDQELVDLGILAAHLELDVLPGFAPDRARRTASGGNLSHRYEPDAHHAFAQIPRAAVR